MTFKATFETDDVAQAAAIAAALGGGSPAPAGGGSAGGSGSPGSTGGSPAPAVEYFPADAGLAPFPSPEGSMIQLGLNGKVYLYNSATDKSEQRDDAYLRDVDGKIITFKLPLQMQGALYASDGSKVPVVLVNSAQPINWFAGDQVAICRGIAWVHETGKWFFIDPNTSGSSGNVTTLPAFMPAKGQQYAPGSASSPGSTTPPMPTPPAAVSPAPGSSGNVIKAGPSQTIKTLADAIAAANNGDTIQLDPGAVFKESVAITKALKITGGGTVSNPGTEGARFSGGAKIDVTGGVLLAQGKGALVPMTDCIFEGLEITGAGLTETVGGGTAGIRNGAAANIVVRGCYLHDNQDGCFSGGYAATWVLEGNLLKDNGIGDGQTHNVYLGHEVIKADFINNTSIIGKANPVAATAKGGGHAYKCRANVSNFNGGYGYAENGTIIDLPEGSTQTVNIKGMTLVKKAGDGNHGVIGYASESQAQGALGVIVSGCNFNLNCDAPFMQCLAGPMMFDSSNTWQGNKPGPNGAGTITGLPA